MEQDGLAAVAKELGREIRVFKISSSSAAPQEPSATSTSQDDVPDDFYDFTAEDYYKITANKMGAEFLKTRKIREAEAAARRARIKKAVIRVRFPDNYVLEAVFGPSETIQNLIDLLKKVIACPDLPFYIYTTPPKVRVDDMSKDFYSLGFAPGAIVYFAYGTPKDADSSYPFLCDDILSLSESDNCKANTPTDQSAEQPVLQKEEPSPASEPKPANKPTKPKWFKM